MIENICWVVLRDIACHVMAKKPLSEQKFTEEECQRIQSVWEQPEAQAEGRIPNAWEQPKAQAAMEQVSHAVASLVQEHSEDAEEILLYLDGALLDIFIRLGAASE